MQEILIVNDAVRDEYVRWHKELESDDAYESNQTVGLCDVLRAHFLIADFFYSENYGIGGVGPRDKNLLHSAIYRQFVAYGGVQKWKNDHERCATLVFGLVKDHPFHDANKRTALLTLLYFLNRMKRVPTAKQKDLEDFIVDISEGSLGKYRRFQELAKEGEDAEIYFIAEYIRRNSRPVDNAHRSVTYHQLNHCLKAYGFVLDNIKDGTIDVYREYETKGFLGFGRKQTKRDRVMPGIPFQKGWKAQVPKGLVTKIREATKLDVQHGVDSASFFDEVDPLHSLIAEYSHPLQRLAYR